MSDNAYTPASRTGSRTDYDLYDDATQPSPLISGYKQTLTRWPRTFYRRALTLTEVTGPMRLAGKLKPGNNDLSRTRHGSGPDTPGGASRSVSGSQCASESRGAAQAIGQRIYLTGRLLDEDGRPIRHSVIELWQANAAGRYIHKADAGNPAPVDPNFLGSGRTLTDEAGRYEFISIKPGAYPVPRHPERWWRPPHIHLSIFGESFMSRLVTQVFFPGEPLNDIDLILQAVPDPRGRARLVAHSIPMMEVPMADVLGYRHDLVVRGHRQTPMVG